MSRGGSFFFFFYVAVIGICVVANGGTFSLFADPHAFERHLHLVNRATKKKREAQRKEGSSCVTERGWGFLSSSEGSFFPGTLGRPILCVFHPQNKPLPYQSPTFGLTLYKFIELGPIQKPRPYNWCCLWESCLCDNECDSLLG